MHTILYETHLKGIKLVAWALKLNLVLFENYYQFNSCIVKLSSMTNEFEQGWICLNLL